MTLGRPLYRYLKMQLKCSRKKENNKKVVIKSIKLVKKYKY